MKTYSGKIIAADSSDKTITIQCGSVSGVIIGREIIIIDNDTDKEKPPKVKDLKSLNESL